MKKVLWSAITLVLTLSFAWFGLAQQAVDPGFESVGRGAAMLADIADYQGVGAGGRGGRGGRGGGGGGGAAFDGGAPAGETPPGIQPLAVDMFTTTDFYQDSDLWSDPRYFRCNSSTAIEGFWTRNAELLLGDDPPRTAAWGHCDRDYPREAIVSPYEFDTAQAHYEALMDESRQRGGPTEHTYATVPGEWTGRYRSAGGYWFRMGQMQIPTVLSLLTDEYQTRFVQETYHHGVTNRSMWPSQYCWPEGFLRRWHGAAVRDHSIMVTPSMVQILAGVADNFITNIHIGREFNMDGVVPRLGADVPRWYGETIGFWDEDVLITWTSNIQGWKVHAAIEHSNMMQSIEIYAPMHDEDGTLVGINHEAIFYDPEALVEPVRIVRDFVKTNDFEQGDPYVFVECLQTIYPIEGVGTPMAPGTVFEYEMLDMYGRPWAQLWEKYWEEGMEQPEEEDIFSFN